MSVEMIRRVPTLGAKVGDPFTVDDDETADALVANGSARRVRTDAPARNASKADWVEHAVSRGADRETAEAMTRDELAAVHG